MEGIEITGASLGKVIDGNAIAKYVLFFFLGKLLRAHLNALVPSSTFHCIKSKKKKKLTISLLHSNRDIRTSLSTEIQALTSTTSFPTPHLLILQLGSSPASSTYIRMKLAAAEASGMTVSHIQVPSDAESGEVPGTGLKKVLEEVRKANNDPRVNGVLVQLPLEGAGKEEEREIVEAVSVGKDVDG